MVRVTMMIRVTMVIVPVGPGDSGSFMNLTQSVVSNEFGIMFQTNGNDTDDGWFLLISIIIVIFIVCIIGLLLLRTKAHDYSCFGVYIAR